MRRLLLVTSLVALLLAEAGSASLPQVIKTKGYSGSPEQDMEEAWGARVVETLKKDNRLMGLLVAPKLAAATWERWQGTKARAGTEDTLGHAPSPGWDPEPDRDDLYHPPPGEGEEAQEEAGLWSRALSPPRGLQGPEEDRDHIYHPRDDSWGP